MKSVVAFANGTGGKIIFGIADKTREMVGFSKEDVSKTMDAIANAVSDSCEPAIIPDITLQTIEDKTVIVVEVSEGRQRPYYIKALGRDGGVYIRVVGTARLADEYMIKELMFEGSNRYFDQTLCTGLSITDEVFQFVLRNIHLGAAIVGIYRQDVFEIPTDAIRELIINAAVHRSYLDHGNIQVAVYDNRLEITSPGKLPMGQTLERMKEGYSQIRNEALDCAFSYMNLIEHWGSGIPKIIGKVKAAGLRKPEFIGGEVDLRVNIYRGQINASGVKNGINSVENDVELAVIDALDQSHKLLKIVAENLI